MLLRWIARSRERRLRRERERERELAHLGEAGSVMAYLDDQIATLNVTIVARHAELEGLVHTHDVLVSRRDALDLTRSQVEAMYRTA